MKCRKCGAEIQENAKFCENCGAPVEAERPEPKKENPIKKPGISLGASFEVGGLLGAVLNRKKKKK